MPRNASGSGLHCGGSTALEETSGPAAPGMRLAVIRDRRFSIPPRNASSHIPEAIRTRDPSTDSATRRWDEEGWHPCALKTQEHPLGRGQHDRASRTTEVAGHHACRRLGGDSYTLCRRAAAAGDLPLVDGRRRAAGDASDLRLVHQEESHYEDR